MKKIISNSRGQALLELLIFLPLFLMFYFVISGFANSINGSINQQKITRTYFFHRIMHNSTTPGPGVLGDTYKGWSVFGLFFIGWRDYFKGESTPVMPCYKVNFPFERAPKDDCGEPYERDRSLWIRVGTVFGLCGATYLYSGGNVLYLPDGGNPNLVSLVVDRNSCILTN